MTNFTNTTKIGPNGQLFCPKCGAIESRCVCKTIDSNKVATDGRCVFVVYPPNHFMDSYRCRRKSGHGPKGDLCWQHSRPKKEYIPIQFRVDEIKNRELESLRLALAEKETEITRLNRKYDDDMKEYGSRLQVVIDLKKDEIQRLRELVIHYARIADVLNPVESDDTNKFLKEANADIAKLDRASKGVTNE